MNQVEIPFLDLPAQQKSVLPEMMEVFKAACESASFIGGPLVSNFEQSFAEFSGSKYSVAVNSGTDALRFALMAMGINQGDHVVTVPNTFVATTEAISQAGGKISFVDVEESTSLMDLNKLEDLLNERFEKSTNKTLRPKFIVPVHLYGQMTDMDGLMQLAGKYDIRVLEDACQAHGAKYKGKGAGTIGEAGAFSFYPGKNLGALGEAGAVTTNNSKIADYIKVIRDHGQRKKYYHEIEGYNGRLDAIQAGCLSVKLKHLKKWNEERQKLARVYDTELSQLPWIKKAEVLPHNISSYHLYVIHCQNRDGLQKHLKDKGVHTGLHYPVPLHLQQCYSSFGYKTGDFPVSEKLSQRLLSLPMFPELGEERVRYVVESIKSFQS